MRKEIKNIQDLFDMAGGSVHLAAFLELNQYTVDRWHKNGIPRKYWASIVSKYNTSVAELFHISEKASKRGKI
jgi:hypothetical protein